MSYEAMLKEIKNAVEYDLADDILFYLQEFNLNAEQIKEMFENACYEIIHGYVDDYFKNKEEEEE